MKHKYWISRHIRRVTMIKTAKSDSLQKESWCWQRIFLQAQSGSVGVVEAVLGPLSYLIKLEDGCIIKRHIDHLLNHSDCKEPSVDDELPLGLTLTQETLPVVNSETSSNSTGESNVLTPETVTPPQSVERRYPQRQT